MSLRVLVRQNAIMYKYRNEIKTITAWFFENLPY